ncbi:MAG: hypothetical protein JNL80_03025 [Phycisphaerae bacterium]|jgi:hypothetical protein|nr:hypothetical protein [Phycisphaerae bacterium]
MAPSESPKFWNALGQVVGIVGVELAMAASVIGGVATACYAIGRGQAADDAHAWIYFGLSGSIFLILGWVGRNRTSRHRR